MKRILILVGLLALPLYVESQVIKSPGPQTPPPIYTGSQARKAPNTPPAPTIIDTATPNGDQAPPPAPIPGMPPLQQSGHIPSFSEQSQGQVVQEAIEEMLKDLRTFDVSKAYYESMSSDFRKEVSLAYFKAFVKGNSSLFRNKSFSFEGMSFNGIIATVKGRITSTDNQTVRVQFDLIQESGVWKIRKVDIIRPDYEKLPNKPPM